MRNKRKRMSAFFLIFIAVIIVSSYIDSNRVFAIDTNQPKMLEELNLTKEIKQSPLEYGGKMRKVAYLTFDDGPTQYTNQLLNVLNEYQVKGTFFLIGSNVEKYPEEVKALYENGHYVGMHSLSHNFDTLYTQEKAIDEMVALQEMIEEIIGFGPSLFRCPYGSVPGLSDSLRQQAVEKQLKTLDWTIDSNDWNLQDDPKRIVETIQSQLTHHREIILLHDKEGTVKALPGIIEMLHQEGYEVVGYSEQAHRPMNFWKDSRL